MRKEGGRKREGGSERRFFDGKSERAREKKSIRIRPRAESMKQKFPYFVR